MVRPAANDAERLNEGGQPAGVGMGLTALGKVKLFKT